MERMITLLNTLLEPQRNGGILSNGLADYKKQRESIGPTAAAFRRIERGQAMKNKMRSIEDAGVDSLENLTI